MDKRRRIALLVTTLALTPVAFGGCTERGSRPAGQAAARSAPPTLALTPAAGTRDVPISAEIGTEVKNGRVAEVKVRDDKGRAVDGTMREDGTAWVPAKPLENKRSYRADVTVKNDSGQTATQNTTFTTMAKSDRQTITSTLYFAGNRTYGTAMPVTVAFDPGIPKEARADVQRRLFVKTEPKQPGTWSWLDDGTQAYYRAPDFWRPGSTISVRAALEGLPIGKDRLGDADRTASSRIGNQVSLDIDNATKQMSVFRDGRLVRRIPVSLGKPSTPSSSGKMVIMEKHEFTTFDTRGEPDGGYVVDVEDAQRLTWGGEFIHAAPWSEGDQGNTNVSHGCANVSSVNADWLMGVTQVGDLVTVRGTEVPLTPGNGWTAWNVSWEEFARGSAPPVPANLKPAPTPSAAPSAPAAVAPPTGRTPAPASSGSGG
ncbi:L,D-transpeptidase [Micromonospora echinofusca]|uniref:L,D-transpeptidase family protein n=1 Tax=Micromonospora echinofusca TaxID=47858 RepID=A0ABS3VZD0_MICEH|nr:Ig-like domain-containing protein [Micromonospora echinofusca]MBO4209882.1 L,D-transpeptidase family protein [Micromonospora echinofusca]